MRMSPIGDNRNVIAFSRWENIKIMINIDNIMRNTFAVVTNRCEIDDILELYEGEDAMFYGNPLDMTVEDIDEVIKYFENTEEYENCMQLVYVKNDKIGELLTKKLMRDAL